MVPIELKESEKINVEDMEKVSGIVSLNKDSGLWDRIMQEYEETTEGKNVFRIAALKGVCCLKAAGCCVQISV